MDDIPVMLKKLISFVGVSLLIARVLANTTSASSNPVSEILNKFHQNDYQLVFEWGEQVRFNKRYFQSFQFKVFKYNRTCAALNTSFTSKIDIGKEAEAVVQAYKFSSNEYRLFQIRFEFNVCEGISKNVIGANGFNKCGNTRCPTLRGIRYEICNWTPDQTRFPPLIPSGKYMLEVQTMFRSEELYLQRFYGTISRPIVIP